MKSFLPVAMLSLAVAGCGGNRDRPADVSASRSTNWRAIVTQPDRERLRGWRDAWVAGLARAWAASPRLVAAQGALFEPDRALAGALPPPGAYRCRVFKLGANGTAMADFTRYPDAQCRIDDDDGQSRFYMMEAAQRPVGRLFADGPNRAVFLGTLMLGEESRSFNYSSDATRDLVGYVERIGDKRWRLVLPSPRFESLLDVIELVPAAG